MPEHESPRATPDSGLAWMRRFADWELRAATAAGGFTLARMQRLAVALEALPPAPFVVHITGTKGKGSVAHLVDALLVAHGLRTLRYTSPHVEHITERWAVDGTDVTDAQLEAAIARIRAGVDADAAGHPGDEASFFEVATAVALTMARDACVDVAILEVGLGGRLDATNVVTPTVAVITSIDLDHTQILGDTIDAIAAEKAGIIKAGRPVLLGVAADERGGGVLRDVARERGAPCAGIGDGITIDRADLTTDARGAPCVVAAGTVSTDNLGDVTLPPCSVSGTGVHAARNALLAAGAAAHVLHAAGRAWDGPRAATAMAAARIPARAEAFSGPPRVLLDGAHTTASLRALAQALRRTPAAGPTVLVLGLTRERDARLLLSELRPACADAVFTALPSARSADPADLACLWRDLGGRADAIANPVAALAAARARAGDTGRVVIAGSFYLAGVLRPLLASAEKRGLI